MLLAILFACAGTAAATACQIVVRAHQQISDSIHRKTCVQRCQSKEHAENSHWLQAEQCVRANSSNGGKPSDNSTRDLYSTNAPVQTAHRRGRQRGEPCSSTGARHSTLLGPATLARPQRPTAASPYARNPPPIPVATQCTIPAQVLTRFAADLGTPPTSPGEYPC